MLQSVGPLSDSRRGETCIGIGLALLIAGSLWPNAPLVTAVALICLGATETTLGRFREKPALLPVIILHALAYTCLYALFVGATLHALAAASAASSNRLAMLDLMASVFPMALALKRILSVLCRPTVSRH